MMSIWKKDNFHKQIISKIERKRCDHAAENTEKYPGDYNAGFPGGRVSGVLQPFIRNYEKGQTVPFHKIIYGT